MDTTSTKKDQNMLILLLIGSATIAILAAIARLTYRYLFVIVPEFTALVMLNLLTGKLEVLFLGFHLKAPWKQVKPENFVSLVKITVPINETYVAKDGSVVKIGGFLQYRSKDTPEGVIKYIATEDSQIVENMVGRVRNHLTKDMSGEDYESVRQHILKLSKDLSVFFEERPAQGETPAQAKEMKDIEDEFGIYVERVVISTVKYDERTQEAITAKFEMETVAGAKTPSDGQLIMLEKKIEKKVWGIDLSSMHPDVARALGDSAAQIAKSASGPVLAAGLAAAAATKGSGKKNKKGGK